MAKAKDGSIHPYYMTSLRGNFTFIDGSVSNDIPVERMSELFNINTYIVSQVNPHFIPFISSDAHIAAETRLKRVVVNPMKTLMANTVTYLAN